jgi:FtsP/CotA-like multicopper oxidase with cupredoxin domain
MKLITKIFAAFVAFSPLAHAEVVEYTLDIRETTISPAGKPVKALTINGGLPGPVLRFKEGDTARIHVVNGLTHEEVSTHWHGLLVPNLEDGVPYLTTPPIFPGKSRTFEFPLKHAGTYWYHSHTGLQEQRGVYGSIVIEPKQGERIRADKEEVLLLSDWTNEDPQEVMRSLMRASDWYAIRKGTAQSIIGAARSGYLKDYFDRERSRLPPMDVSDVAYDAFLINGKSRSTIHAKPGERIRLRIINAAASTYFYLNSAAGPLSIVAADGVDVQPIKQNRLLIGMAETYDVLFTVPGTGAWEFRATAQDGSGKASVLIGAGEEQPASDIERLNPYSMNAALATVLDQLDETGQLSEKEALSSEKPRPLPPYKRLKAVKPTTLPKTAPVRRIQLKLNGDMMRYIWTMNGTTLTEDSTIPVKKGEVLQIEIRNDSMMHHPMHLHGHFFRLLMEDGPDPKYAPLKHTVDVPPMSKRVIEFYANEEKDWAFHCHLLYHMHAGMMKVVSYDDQGEDHKPSLDLKNENPFYFLLDGNVQSQMTMGYARLMNARDDFGVMWKAGWGQDESDMAQSMHGGMGSGTGNAPEIEYEIDLLWMHYINPRWMTMAGFRFTNMMEDDENTAFAGASYRLPYMFDLTGTVESNGDLRFSLAKTFQITDRLSAFGRVEYDTAQDWMWMAGANFTVSKNIGVIASFDSDYGFGAGLSFRF